MKQCNIRIAASKCSATTFSIFKVRYFRTFAPFFSLSSNAMATLSKAGRRQSTLNGFWPKLSSQEWQAKMEEQRRLAPNPSVEIIPTPSVQIVKAEKVKSEKRRPGRPRKLRQLVDLTSPEESAKKPSPATPSPSRTRIDWSHPAVFIRIYRQQRMPQCRFLI